MLSLKTGEKQIFDKNNRVSYLKYVLNTMRFMKYLKISFSNLKKKRKNSTFESFGKIHTGSADTK